MLVGFFREAALASPRMHLEATRGGCAGGWQRSTLAQAAVDVLLWVWLLCSSWREHGHYSRGLHLPLISRRNITWGHYMGCCRLPCC